MHQSCHHDEEHTDDDDTRATEARESLFGIKHSRDEKNGNGTQEYQVGTQLGKQQYRKHRQHGEDRNPCVKVKT